MPRHCPLTLAEHRLLRDTAGVVGKAMERQGNVAEPVIDDAMKHLLEAIPEGVIVHDNSGNTMFTNASALRLIGARGGQADVPRNISSILSRVDARHEDGRRVRARDIPSLRESDSGHDSELIASILIVRTGERRWVVFRSSANGDGGQRGGPRICIVRDWTEQYITAGLQRVTDGVAEAVSSHPLDPSFIVTSVRPVVENLLAATCDITLFAIDRGATGKPRYAQQKEALWLVSSLHGMLQDQCATLDDLPSRELEGLNRPLDWYVRSGVGAFGPGPGDADRHVTPGGTRLVSVPIQQDGSLLGTMTFTRPIHVSPFAQSDLELMREIVVRIGMALTTISLRTQLADSQLRLDRAMEQLAAASDMERRRVALSIHDGLAQVATSTYQHLESLSTRYSGANGDQNEELMHVRALARQTVREARRVIADLRPTSLEELDLNDAIRYEISTMRDDGWDVRFAGDFDDRKWPSHVRCDTLRVIQESLSNVRKYAGQARVDVVIVGTDRAVRLTISDHGKGFDATRVPTHSSGSEHVGLGGIRERVSLLGGTVTIQSAVGAGTTIDVTIPMGS